MPGIQPVTDALAVAVPQLAPRDRPDDRTSYDTLHHRAATQVKPDHRIRTLPKQISQGSVVLVFGHPAGSGGEGVHIGLEVLTLHPAWSMVQGIEFEPGQPKQHR